MTADPGAGTRLNELQEKIVRALQNRPGLRAITLARRLNVVQIMAMDNLCTLTGMESVQSQPTSCGMRYYALKDSVLDATKPQSTS